MAVPLQCGKRAAPWRESAIGNILYGRSTHPENRAKVGSGVGHETAVFCVGYGGAADELSIEYTLCPKGRRGEPEYFGAVDIEAAAHQKAAYGR